MSKNDLEKMLVLHPASSQTITGYSLANLVQLESLPHK